MGQGLFQHSSTAITITALLSFCAQAAAQAAPTPAAPASPAPPSSASPPGSAATPDPAASVPAPPAPPPATPTAPEVPAAAPAPAVAAPQPAPPSPETPAAPSYAAPTKARVEIRVNYTDAWLELRSVTYGGPWRRACLAPCGKILEVDGMEARVRAAGMTTTSTFRLQPGTGTARLRVDGGSAGWRDRGVWLLALGTPVALIGGAMFGFGTYNDSGGLRTAGVATMISGGLAVVASLPMLMSGSTTVRNFNGKVIAQRPGVWTF